MKIIHGLKALDIPAKGSVVTVGVFDGVHVGHKKIISHAVARARALGLKSVAVTFDPHPLKVLYPKVKIPSLISLEHRIRTIRALGIDYVALLAFTRAMSRISPEKFVKDILIGKLGMKEIYVGDNFFFGRGARAGTRMLEKLSSETDFKAVALKHVKINGRIVSSSLIRQLIVKGDLKQASRMLGRPVSILGTVVHGAKRGRLLGFPTANINPHHEAIPPSAVYAVTVKLNRKIYKAVLNIGIRPTFHRWSHELEPTVEVHLLGFNEDIYGKDIEVIFIKKMRDQFKFKTKEALMAQIHKDVKRARAYFGHS
jgi:riboflavin kinase/FMN adenylyltransferase